MKRIITLLLISIIALSIIGCENNTKVQKDTKEYVLDYIEKKGIEKICWKDFDYLENKDIGFGTRISEYKLKNSVKLLLIGSNKKYPDKIVLVENNKKTILKDYKKSSRKLKRMIMLDGTIYIDTGYKSSALRCGNKDGVIKYRIDKNKKPIKDSQSNFGMGYGYQYWNDYVQVEIDNSFINFCKEGIDPKIIPNDVANFEAKIIENNNDVLLLKITNIDKKFKHCFDLKYDKNVNDIKQVAISLSAIKNLKPNENLNDKKIKVYFNGVVKNYAPELSMPITLDEIYKVEIIR